MERHRIDEFASPEAKAMGQAPSGLFCLVFIWLSGRDLLTEPWLWPISSELHQIIRTMFERFGPEPVLLFVQGLLGQDRPFR